jgi:16S rRNA (guanine527-N7)-methyltransferase
VPDALSAVLDEARALGFLGPGEPAAHRTHSLGFAAAYDRVEPQPPARFCDLGAGGGVPGLVLAATWPTTRAVLLDASTRRCSFLEAAVARLGLSGRVEVACGRAEVLARDPSLEASFDLVCARSFAGPAATAECATRLLAADGLLLVSDPPASPEAARGPRWSEEGLARLSLRYLGTEPGPPAIASLRRAGPLDPAFPRRDGVPARRPLF